MKVIKAEKLSQWMKIYHLYQAAFPKSEKKPFSMIFSMCKKGKSDAWYCEKNGRFAGLVITINGTDKILIDYLAVHEKMRGCGIGSELLQVMRQIYEGKGIFLEIEEVDENAENYEERKNRKKFYLSNGMTEMNVYVELFGVDMELLGYGCSLSAEEYKNFYRENYNEWAASHIKSRKK